MTERILDATGSLLERRTSRRSLLARTTVAAPLAAFCSAACSAGASFLHSASENTRKVGSIRWRVSAMQQATSLNLNEMVVATVCS